MKPQSSDSWPNTPLVSCIMLVTRDASVASAKLSVRSLLNQNHKLKEVVVFNTTGRRLSHSSKVKEINLKMMSKGKMVNLCILNSEGDIITLVSPDTYYSPEFISEVAECSVDTGPSVFRNKTCYDISRNQEVLVSDNRIYVPIFKRAFYHEFEDDMNIDKWQDHFNYLHYQNNSAKLLTKFVQKMYE